LQKVLEAKKDELRELDDKVARLRENAAREAYAAVRQNNLADSAQSQVDLLALTMTTARPHLVKYVSSAPARCRSVTPSWHDMY
jgi:arginyl-tRNA synthetase